MNKEIKECLCKEVSKLETMKVLLEILKELEEMNNRIKRLEERGCYTFYGDSSNQGIINNLPFYTTFSNTRTIDCGDGECDKGNKM